MSFKPKAKSLRAADGMELISRFAKQARPTIRAADGIAPGLPGGENFGGANAQMYQKMSADLQTKAPPPPKVGTQVDPTALLGSGSWQNIPMPQVGMRDGGELHAANGFLGSLRKAMLPTDAEKAAKAQYLAETRPAPAQAPAPAATGISGYVGNGALEGRMKAAGLRDGGGDEYVDGHGGEVQGNPRAGDVKPALYTGGEFVASNAMLRKEPELRQHLRSLREEVLAEKGMTVAQADAKALNGGALRADLGWTADALQGKRMAPPATPVQNMADQLRGGLSDPFASEQTYRAAPTRPPNAFAPGYTPPPVDDKGRYKLGGASNEGSIQSRAAAGQPGPKTPPVGVGTPAAGVQAGGAGAGGSGRPGLFGSVREGVGNLRTGLGTQPGPVSKSAFLAGKVLSNPLVAGAGKLAGAAGVLQNFNDYKINDPDVDSSASGTWNALREGDLPKVGRSLSKGLVETGMDLGSFAANTADYFVPGKAPVSTAYNKMLRRDLGDQLTDNSGANRPPAPASSAPAATNNVADPKAVQFSAQRQLRQGPMGADVNPYHGDLTPQIDAAMKNSQTDLASTGMRANDVYKTVGKDGRVSYSGYGDGSGTAGSLVSGDGRALRSGGSVSSVPGMSKELIAQTLRNPDGSTWSAGDNAIMAANLRDGVDKYRGTSRDTRGAGQDEFAHLPFKVAAQMRVAKMAQDTAAESNKTALRGQDMDLQAKLAPAKYAAQLRGMKAEALRQAGGNYGLAGKLWAAQGGDPKDFLDAQASETADATAVQGQGDKAREGMAKEFLAYNPADGKVNDDLSARRFAAVQKIMPGADIMSPEGRSKNLPEMQMLAKIFDRVSGSPQMGMDKINPLVPKGASRDAMPDLKGAKLVRQGLAGAFTPGSTANSYYLQTPNGDVPLGADLSERELEIIRHATESGSWRGAPKKTQ